MENNIRWFYCDEESTKGLIDVTIEGDVDFPIDEIEGDIEWLVYYSRFQCLDTPHNIQVIEECEAEIEEDCY